MRFGDELKRHMEEQEVRPSHLARLTGYSAPYISDLFAGERRWNETTINKACDVLGLEVRLVKKVKK